MPLQSGASPGIRVVSGAELTNLGLVGFPSFHESKVEIRARSGLSLKSLIPSGTDLACECSPGGCTFARFGRELLNETYVNIFQQQAREVISVFGDFKSPLGSVGKGSVRGSMNRGGTWKFQ